MASARRTPRLGNNSTRTGLGDRLDRAEVASERDRLVSNRGTDELLARAREAGADDRGPDESTLTTVESLLRDV